MAAAPRSGSKAHTAGCAKCLFLRSLREGGVTASTVAALCDRMRLQRARRGQVLYLEGNGATHLYAVRSGRVKLFRSDAHGGIRVTGLLGPGDLFGFEALFDEVYASGAEAMTDTEICLASADHLQELLHQVPGMIADFARYLHQQLSLARAQQAASTASGAPAKVAGYLIASASPSARPGAGPGELIAAEGLTLGDIGGLLGLARETVCRVLADLRAQRIVETGASGVKLLDLEALRAISGL